MAERYKKGQSGNPGGRPRLPDDLKFAKKLTQEEFIRSSTKYLRYNRFGLKQVIKDTRSSSLDVFICNLILRAIKYGDQGRAGFLLDRIIGKTVDVIQLQKEPPPITLVEDDKTVDK